MIRKAISKKMDCFPHSSPTRWQGSSVRKSFGTDLTLPKWHTKGLNFILLWLTLPFIVIKISTPSWYSYSRIHWETVDCLFFKPLFDKKGEAVVIYTIHLPPSADSYLSSQPYPRTTLPKKPEMIVSLCFSDFAWSLHLELSFMKTALWLTFGVTHHKEVI